MPKQMKYKRKFFKRNKKFLRNSISKKSLPSHVMSGLTSFFESDACRMNFRGIPDLWGSPMTKFWGHPQNFCPSLVSCSSFHCNRTNLGIFEIFSKILSQSQTRNVFSLIRWGDGSFWRIFESLSKFCPSFYCRRGNRIFDRYDRALVAPTYPVAAGLRSSVVPLSTVNQNRKFW